MLTHIFARKQGHLLRVMKKPTYSREAEPSAEAGATLGSASRLIGFVGPARPFHVERSVPDSLASCQILAGLKWVRRIGEIDQHGLATAEFDLQFLARAEVA